MDNLQLFKEKQINDYLSNIDLINLDINQMKRDLKSKLGEEPAIKINYINQKMLKEGTSEEINVQKQESITIIFTVEREIAPGLTAPFPITQTFIIG